MLGVPHHLTKEQEGYKIENANLFHTSGKMVRNLEYQNFLQLMESGYTNFSLIDASIISSDCAETTLGLSLYMNKKRGEKFHTHFLKF